MPLSLRKIAQPGVGGSLGSHAGELGGTDQDLALSESGLAGAFCWCGEEQGVSKSLLPGEAQFCAVSLAA